MDGSERPTRSSSPTPSSRWTATSPVEELAELCVDRVPCSCSTKRTPCSAPSSRRHRSGGGRVGTLSKTLGSLGGFIAADDAVIDLLVNRARPFIFSTALSPPDVAAARAALAIVRSPEGDALVERLTAIVDRLCPGHGSPIIPIIIGDEREAVAASTALADRGVLIPAIRPPTVPVGTSRLRLALSAAHTDRMIDSLVGVMTELLPWALPDAS